MSAEFTIRDEQSRQFALDSIGRLNVAKPWTVTLAPFRKKRSLSQNALMWKWLDEVAGHISETTGYSPEEVHEHMKRKFLTPKRIEIDGEITESYSTRNLTTAEMTDYLNRIYVWATSEMGLFLTNPEDQGR